MIRGKNVKKPTIVKGSVESVQERAEKGVKSAKDMTTTFMKDGNLEAMTQKGKERMLNLSFAEILTLGICLISVFIGMLRIYGVITGSSKFESVQAQYTSELQQVQGELDVMKSDISIHQEEADQIQTYSSNDIGRLVAKEQMVLSTAAEGTSSYDENAVIDALSNLSQYFTDVEDAYAWLPKTADVSANTSSVIWTYKSTYESTDESIPSVWSCYVSSEPIAIATATYQAALGKFTDLEVYYYPSASRYMDLSKITLTQSIYTGADNVQVTDAKEDVSNEVAQPADDDIIEQTGDEQTSASDDKNNTNSATDNSGTTNTQTTESNTDTTTQTSKTKTNTNTNTNTTTQTSKPNTNTTTQASEPSTNDSVTQAAKPNNSVIQTNDEPNADISVNKQETVDNSIVPPGTIGNEPPINNPYNGTFTNS